jgi:hypothetical protein
MFPRSFAHFVPVTVALLTAACGGGADYVVDARNQAGPDDATTADPSGESEQALAGDVRYIQAEAMGERTAATANYYGWNASGSYGKVLYNKDSRVRGYVNLPTAGYRRVRVAVWATRCSEWSYWPVLGMGIWKVGSPANDPGTKYSRGIDNRVAANGYSYYEWNMGTHYLRAGDNEVYLSFDAYDQYIAGQCDANLYVDYIKFVDE